MRSVLIFSIVLVLTASAAETASGFTLNAACEKYRAACSNKTYFGQLNRHAVPTCMWRAALKAKDSACLAPARSQIQAARKSTAFSWQRAR